MVNIPTRRLDTPDDSSYIEHIDRETHQTRRRGRMNAFKEARMKAGHSQQEAARLVYCTVRAIQRTEAAEHPNLARLELYLIKTGQKEAVI